MITLDIAHIFTEAGGVRGLMELLEENGQGVGLAYPTVQMWKQRNSIPSAWIGAVLYVMQRQGVPLIDLLIDTDELCGS